MAYDTSRSAGSGWVLQILQRFRASASTIVLGRNGFSFSMQRLHAILILEKGPRAQEPLVVVSQNKGNPNIDPQILFIFYLLKGDYKARGNSTGSIRVGLEGP